MPAASLHGAGQLWTIILLQLQYKPHGSWLSAGWRRPQLMPIATSVLWVLRSSLLEQMQPSETERGAASSN
jgi:hypothetical protein